MTINSIRNFFFRSMPAAFCVFIFMFSCFFAYGQPTPPQIRCISVETNGNVTLTWLAPVDTGTTFGGYHIFSSSSAGGPFVPADSIFNYSTLTTTITSVNANNAIFYYYIKTRQGCCNIYSASSDTLRTIRMIVTPLSNEVVRLNWNRTHTPPLPTTLSSFTLSKELTPGVYTNFRTLLDTTTTDTNYFCNKFINYRVTQGDVSGCSSVSSIDGETFRDTKGPAKPLLDTVSIDMATGDVNISWFPDSSGDTFGYVIFQFNGLSYDSIGAVLGINSLSYTYTLTNSANEIETFSVAAFDSCKNLGSLATNHNTMLLEKSFVKCTATVTLDWNAYQNMNADVQRYEIWYRENAGLWTQAAFVPPNVLSYDMQLVTQGSTYEFLVRAVGGDGQTASSNIVSQVADIFSQPAFLYIRYLNVTGSAVWVRAHVDDTAPVVSYRLYRSTYQSGPFTLVSEVPYSSNSSLNILDPGSSADKQKTYYKITAKDSCGLEQISSNIAGTVFLVAEGGDNLTSELNWIDYSGWQGPTGHFNIYNAVGEIVAPSPFASVSGDTLFYTDDVSDFPVQNGNICYAVQAVEDSVNSFGFLDSSMSNIACAPQSPAVYIPNAFTPKGKNPIFRAYLLFGNPSTFSLNIFNRWGQLVFSSNNPEIGWNGTYQNSDAESGIYAYQLIFKGYNKKEVRRMGTVMLVR